MKDNRPVNLDISSYRLPLPAYASFFHRVSGILLFLGIAVLLWLLDRSLASPEGFESLRAASRGPLVKLLLWAVLSALAYHSVAGVRHLLMDVGLGESKQAGRTSTLLTFFISAVLIILLGVWIW